MTKRSNKYCPKIQSDDDAQEGIELNRAAKIHIKSHIKTKPGTDFRHRAQNWKGLCTEEVIHFIKGNTSAH